MEVERERESEREREQLFQCWSAVLFLPILSCVVSITWELKQSPHNDFCLTVLTTLEVMWSLTTLYDITPTSSSVTMAANDHTHPVTWPLTTPSHPCRRKAYHNLEGRAFAGCLGKKKQKRKIMYSSHHTGEFETYDLVLYEPVVLVENFQYRSLVLIGE